MISLNGKYYGRLRFHHYIFILLLAVPASVIGSVRFILKMLWDMSGEVCDLLYKPKDIEIITTGNQQYTGKWKPPKGEYTVTILG